MIKISNSVKIDYQRLLDDLRGIKSATEEKVVKRINTVVVSGYWLMGKRLCQEDIFKADSSQKAGGTVLSRLSEDLRIEYTLITRIIKFYKLWPKENPAKKNSNISWSHYKVLIAIDEEPLRRFYLDEAQSNQWNKLELATRVKRDYFRAIQEQPKKKTGKVLARADDRLYLYSGKVQRVIDGDTLLVLADLGFHVMISVRIRLRGINTQELTDDDEKKARLALKAKEYVENQLKQVDLIIFQSFKVDLYGRYVGDVYYLPNEEDKEKIFKKGRFLNQDLLNKGLAKIA